MQQKKAVRFPQRSCNNDIGTLHCDFDNGRSLGVLWGVDNFTVIGQEEAPAEDESLDMM